MYKTADFALIYFAHYKYVDFINPYTKPFINKQNKQS